MRGFLVGLFLMFFLVISVLSLRPGGFRHQLRNVARRFKLAMILVGIYLVCSTVLRLVFPSSTLAEVGMAVLGVGLCVTFLVLSPDRPHDDSRRRA